MWRLRPIVALGFAALISVVATAASAQREAVERVVIPIGDQRTVDARGVADYSVGDAEIVDVRLRPNGEEMVFVGQQPGQTSVLMFRDNGTQVRYIVTVPPRGSTRVSGPGPVAPQVNIRLDLYFVELTDTSSLQVGIGWPAALGGDGNSIRGVFNLSSGSLTSAIATFEQVLPRIDVLHATGWGRIQRHVVLVTANGTQAEYESGGNINIPIPGTLGTTELRSVRFGSRLGVTPRYDAESGRVEVQIEAEMSELLETGQGVPGTTNTSARATANLELGQTLALAGLAAQSERTGRAGLPGLSQIPIIGILFGSHTDRSEQTENLLLIVPTVVESSRPGSRRLIDEALRIYQDSSSDPTESGLLQSGFPNQTPTPAPEP